MADSHDLTELVDTEPEDIPDLLVDDLLESVSLTDDEEKAPAPNAFDVLKSGARRLVRAQSQPAPAPAPAPIARQRVLRLSVISTTSESDIESGSDASRITKRIRVEAPVIESVTRSARIKEHPGQFLRATPEGHLQCGACVRYLDGHKGHVQKHVESATHQANVAMRKLHRQQQASLTSSIRETFLSAGVRIPGDTELTAEQIATRIRTLQVCKLSFQ